MARAHLILCEKSTRWATAFRREWKGAKSKASLPLKEVRSLVQCERELAESPHSLVAVETTAANAPLVQARLFAWSSQFPQARFVILASPELREFELLLREAGALEVAYSPRELAPVVRLAQRHLARAPKEEQSLEEAIWANLPWQSQANLRDQPAGS